MINKNKMKFSGISSSDIIELISNKEKQITILKNNISHLEEFIKDAKLELNIRNNEKV